MKILHLIASVDAEGGGPIEYARIMAREHAALGHDSVFVTVDPPNACALEDFPFEVRAAGPAKPRVLAFSRYAKAVSIAAAEADVAVIHGLWNVATMAGLSALEAKNVPWVTFTHGMLDPYFRSIKPIKHWFKQLVWTLQQGRALSGAHSVLFTCEEEMRLAQGAFWGHQSYKRKVLSFCAADLMLSDLGFTQGKEVFASQVPNLMGRKYFLFLSRIHPKKACDNLIHAFANVSDLHKDIDLVFAGPDQVGWQRELETLAKDLGVESRIHWAGMTSGASKAAAFKYAEAFVLPSHQENFGIVVAEALSVSLPVLVSNRVNIWREVVEDKAGMSGEDTVEDTANVLRDFLNLPDGERVKMKYAARSSYDERFSIGSAVRDLMMALQEAVDA